MEGYTFTFKELSREELRAVRDLGIRSFPPPLGHIMAALVHPHGLVIRNKAGEIVAFLSITTTEVGGRRIAIFEWGMVDQAHRGKGMAKIGLKAALNWAREQGFDKIASTGVQGYDSAAWNATHRIGLRYWPTVVQIREFGLRWFKLILMLSPLRRIGAFVLHHPPDEQEVPETDGVAGLVGVILLLGFLLLPLSQLGRMLWGGADLINLNFANLLLGTGILAVYWAARTLAHWLAARAAHVPLDFRIWDSGLIIAAVVAGVFGLFLPGLGGSYYIRKDGVIYSQARHVIGKIMLPGVVTSLALYAAFTLLGGFGASSVDTIATLGRAIGFSFGLTDTLLFWPFQAFHATHLWRWRPAIGVTALAAFLAIWFALPQLF